LILCLKSKRTCQRVVVALKFHSTTDGNLGAVGSGNVYILKPVTSALLSLLKTFRCAPCHPQATCTQNRTHELFAVSGLRAHIFNLDQFKGWKLVSLRGGELLHTCMQESEGDL